MVSLRRETENHYGDDEDDGDDRGNDDDGNDGDDNDGGDDADVRKLR